MRTVCSDLHSAKYPATSQCDYHRVSQFVRSCRNLHPLKLNKFRAKRALAAKYNGTFKIALAGDRGARNFHDTAIITVSQVLAVPPGSRIIKIGSRSHVRRSVPFELPHFPVLVRSDCAETWTYPRHPRNRSRTAGERKVGYSVETLERLLRKADPKFQPNIDFQLASTVSQLANKKICFHVSSIIL